MTNFSPYEVPRKDYDSLSVRGKLNVKESLKRKIRCPECEGELAFDKNDCTYFLHKPFCNMPLARYRLANGYYASSAA